MNRVLLNCAFLAALSSALPSQAQQSAADYPTRPVSVIAGNTPGGPIETEMRIYATMLTESFGKPFIVEFKPGAGVALNYVARAKPDGHNLVSATSSLTIPLREPTFDPIKDFAPISLMTRQPSAIYVYPGLPVRNLKELIAYAKANPGKLNYGTSGPGGSVHMYGLWLAGATGMDLTFVHYKGGTLALTDLMAGRIHLYRQSLSGAMPLVKAGKMRVIAMASKIHSPLLPDVRTVAEDGYDSNDGASWGGIVTTGGTPAAIVNRLSMEFQKIARSPEAIKKMGAFDARLVGSTSEEFAQHIRSEVERYTALIKQFNITLE